MKILFFIDGLGAGGKERRLTELLKALEPVTEIDFELVVMNKNIHYQEIKDLDIRIHYLIRKTKKDLSIFKKFYTICKTYKPDIVHCWNNMTAIYAIPACKLLSIKLVNGMISDAPGKQTILNKNLWWAKMTFPFSNVIVGNSQAGLEAYKVAGAKSYLIHNGFNFERIKNLTENEKIRDELQIKTKFVIGMVASFSRFKDYKTYYKAAQLLLSKKNDITFIAIGSDTNSIESQNLINAEYTGNIKLLGRKSNVESYIDAMDICVLSTFTEGISNSILEYMALQKPVIATSGGGTNEIIEDKKTGFLIKPEKPEELAEKIEILLNDNELRHQMGIDGHKRIHEMFSINLMTTNFINCYKSILN